MARPFIPARDLATSKAFYEAIGFTKLLDGEVAIFACGSGGFIVQNYYVQGWAENCMMQLMVDDLDAWWAHLNALDVPARFGVQSAGRVRRRTVDNVLRVEFTPDRCHGSTSVE